ncbi:hypothetical protein QBC39DRAFT_41227 [Podospora conica]|nr:hypothetical protein QBC39DRAFT_41227 [Schizothecium conicum]
MRLPFLRLLFCSSSARRAASLSLPPFPRCPPSLVIFSVAWMPVSLPAASMRRAAVRFTGSLLPPSSQHINTSIIPNHPAFSSRVPACSQSISLRYPPVHSSGVKRSGVHLEVPICSLGCASWSPISSQSPVERIENQDLVTKQQITSQTRDTRDSETLQFEDLSPPPALTTASSLALASPVIVIACGERLMRSSRAFNQRRQQPRLSRVALLLI